MSTVQIGPRDSVVSSHTIVIRGGVFTNMPKSTRRRRVPAAIPADQAYYWSRRWQHDERESVAEIERGEAHRFEDANAAIRWLLSDD